MPPAPPDYLTPYEARRMFGVSNKTLIRWAKAGRLPFIRTLGGHRRYVRTAVEAALSPSAPDDGPEQ